MDFSTNLKQNALSLLLYSDDHCRLVKSFIPIELWSSDPILVGLIKAVYEYIDLWSMAPKSEHVTDILDTLKFDPKQRAAIDSVVDACQQREEDITNYEMIITQLKNFYRQCTITNAIQNVVPLLNDPSKLDDIEQIIISSVKRQTQVISQCYTLKEAYEKLLDDLHKEDAEDQNYLFTKIDPFDYRKLVPQRKALTVLLGLSGMGKSWAMIHFGACGIFTGKKVLHITNELRKEDVAKRYIQNINARCTSREAQEVRRFSPDSDKFELIPVRVPSIYDGTFLNRRIRALNSNISGSDYGTNEDNLKIVEYGTHQLSIKKLEALLDSFDFTEGWLPDELIIDSPDLMQQDFKDLRNSHGLIFKEIRRIIGERNMFGIVSTQANREAQGSEGKQKRLEGKNVGEDWSKYQTADLFYTYYCTELERELGLAHMYCAKGRSEKDKLEVMLTQDYTSGQFCIKAIVENGDWKNKLKEMLKQEADKL